MKNIFSFQVLKQPIVFIIGLAIICNIFFLIGDFQNLNVKSILWIELIIFFIALLVAINHQKNYHSNLISQEERYNLALSSGLIGTWIWDPKKDEIIPDRFMSMLFRLEEKDFPRTYDGFIELVHPDDRNNIHVNVNKSLEKNTAYNASYRIICPDKTIIHILARGEVHKDKFGNIQYLAGVCEDVTELVEKEIMLKTLNETLETKVKERTAIIESQSKKLAESNIELEQFAFAASHDLQEPLRKITSFGDILKHNHCDRLDSTAIEYLNYMCNAASRMRKIIFDLLELSRISTKGNNFTNVDLNNLVKDVIKDMEISIEESGADIHISNLPSIYGDRAQIYLLFKNLISNSIKYRKNEVKPIIEINYKKGLDQKVEIDFIDNGIGFEKDQSERIFIMFQRLHPRDVYEGTGIGLAICKKVISMHNGSIAAKSKLNHGSTFTVTLPVGGIA